MTQADLERTLRSTLDARAGTVTDGPTWDGAHAPDHTAIAIRRRRRWLAPLAAAAVVVTVAAGAIALRHDDRPTESNPAAIEQPPIPTGMQAVDALGVEIFVPSAFKMDAMCSGQTVLRPVATTPALCPLSITDTLVSISPATKSAPAACAERIALAAEQGCLDLETLSPVNHSYSATWPAHGVTVTASGRDKRLASQIVPVRTRCRSTGTVARRPANRCCPRLARR